ncbi:hypothetical protein LR48_Vigan03g102200 [Vigna angularis]|uniref:Uncharacterized protein n=1 Tax=Phaseolus angularis TaxID=3914 RepID=A0A0L9U4C6_PHAAN|nr:hypothetical protein LR48_Vigan03g102200 [Vigna angularis]
MQSVGASSEAHGCHMKSCSHYHGMNKKQLVQQRQQFTVGWKKEARCCMVMEKLTLQEEGEASNNFEEDLHAAAHGTITKEKKWCSSYHVREAVHVQGRRKGKEKSVTVGEMAAEKFDSSLENEEGSSKGSWSKDVVSRLVGRGSSFTDLSWCA